MTANVPPPPAYYIDETSLQSGNYGQPLVLNRIFKLLVAMIDRLQKTAAAQADRLNFLSDWQKAYTEKINKIHVFAANNGDGNQVNSSGNNYFDPTVDDPDDSDSAEVRNSLNETNTAFTTQMQGYSQVVGDEAKALQANVTQTNTAVSSQNDMASSILQQLSAILTAIYSG